MQLPELRKGIIQKEDTGLNKGKVALEKKM